MICQVVTIYYYVVILRIVLHMVVEFGRMPWGHPVRRISDGLGLAVDPVLRPLRAIIPPVRAGGVGLDLSPLVLLVGLSILLGVVC